MSLSGWPPRLSFSFFFLSLSLSISRSRSLSLSHDFSLSSPSSSLSLSLWDSLSLSQLQWGMLPPPPPFLTCFHHPHSLRTKSPITNCNLMCAHGCQSSSLSHSTTHVWNCSKLESTFTKHQLMFSLFAQPFQIHLFFLLAPSSFSLSLFPVFLSYLVLLFFCSLSLSFSMSLCLSVSLSLSLSLFLSLSLSLSLSPPLDLLSSPSWNWRPQNYKCFAGRWLVHTITISASTHLPRICFNLPASNQKLYKAYSKCRSIAVPHCVLTVIFSHSERL